MLTIEELKTAADKRELKYHSSIGAKKLLAKIEKYDMDNAGVEPSTELSPEDVDTGKEVDIVDKEITEEEELLEVMNNKDTRIDDFHFARRKYIELQG